MRMWLRFIVINQAKEVLQEWLTGQADAEHSGLAAVIDCDLEMRLQDAHGVDGQWKACDESLQSYMLREEVQFGQHVLLGRQFSGKQLVLRFAQMSRQLEDHCTILFKSRLDVIQRLFVAQQVRLVSPSVSSPPYVLRPFFKTVQKVNDFWSVFQVAKKHAKPLCD